MDYNQVGDGIIEKKSSKHRSSIMSRSKSLATESSEIGNQKAVRKSILEKRLSSGSLTICKSSVNDNGWMEESEIKPIYAVSEASNASMEHTPIKVNLEPILSNN